MASAARDLRYQNYQGSFVDGSLARDLDWAVRERDLRRAGEMPRHQEQSLTREKVREQEKAHVRVRERQHVSAFSLVGFGVVIAMAVVMLMGYIQLTVLAAETVELKTQLETLNTENVRLTARYEQLFDLATVKEAAEAAGMVKPSASQIGYIDLSGGDRAVVYQKEDTSMMGRMAESLHTGICAAVEYFD